MAGSYFFSGHEIVGAHVKQGLEAIGWQRVDSVSSADAVLTYCVSTSLLEDTYFDDDGLVKNAAAGTLLVDLSPSTPSFAREISAIATVNELVFVEAPLVVRDPLGQLEFACYAACEEPDGVERARALLEAVATTVEMTGAPGSAQLAKAADTVRMAAVFAGVMEAEALVRSTRGLVQLEGDAEEDGDFSGGFPVELALADVVAAMNAADDVDLILPQLEAVMHLLELLVVIGGARMNPSALSLLYREEAASAAQGLDWSRAEGLYAEQEHAHAHSHSHDDGFDEFYDEGDFGFAGGFGAYSAN